MTYAVMVGITAQPESIENSRHGWRINMEARKDSVKGVGQVPKLSLRNSAFSTKAEGQSGMPIPCRKSCKWKNTEAQESMVWSRIHRSSWWLESAVQGCLPTVTIQYFLPES